MEPTFITGNLICPNCGASQPAKIPTNACVPFYTCNACGKLAKAKEGTCCVFCSYGDRPCPLQTSHEK